MLRTEERMHKLFIELVPAMGKAPTLAGELVRACNQIHYRAYNDGDRLGVGYGKETCNPAGRFLCARGGDEVAKAVRAAWDAYDDDEYDAALDDIADCLIKHLDNHPELKTTENIEDMWDFSDDSDATDGDDEYYTLWGEEEGYDDYGDDYYEGWD